MCPCVNLAIGPWEYVFSNITYQKQLKYKIMASIRKLPVTVCSYNMHGFNSSKINYVTDLLVLLQQHWINNNQLATFNCYFPGYCVHGISALDNSKMLIGCPNGGVLIIYPDTFGAKAKFISTTSKRLCALSLHIIIIRYFIALISSNLLSSAP